MILRRTTAQKLLETGFLVVTWLALGLYLEIFGPTQKDLKINTNSNYEQVALATSGRSIGLFPGCVLGGFLVDKFGNYCHLLIAVCLDIAAVVTFIIPWLTDVNLLWACCFIGGAVEAAINVAGQRRILSIWLEKSAAPMILLHMGYGIGSFTVPLYSNPFLAIPEPTPDNCTVVNKTLQSTQGPTNCLNETEAAEPTKYVRETQIQYPYSISGVLVALLSVAFFVYQVLTLKNLQKKGKETSLAESKTAHKAPKGSEEQRTLKEMINPATCAGGRFWYGIQLFSLLFFYFANSGGGERMVASFIRSFSIDQLGFTMDNGSYLNTTFWISFTAGRLVFFALARWISIRVLILIETGGLVLTGILMNIFARNNSTAYWVLTQPLGLFIAPCWPSGVAWTDFHIELTGLGMTLMLLGGSIGGFVHLRIIGYLYENLGYHTYLYQVLGYGVFAFIMAIVLTFVGAQHGSRFEEKREKIIEEEMKMLEIREERTPSV